MGHLGNEAQAYGRDRTSHMVGYGSRFTMLNVVYQIKIENNNHLELFSKKAIK